MPIKGVVFLVEGVPWSFLLFAISLFLGILFSIGLAWGMLVSPKPVRRTGYILVYSWNAIPHLLIVLFFFYGLPLKIPFLSEIAALWIAGFALALGQSGYLALLWIQAISSIPQGEKDASKVVGFSDFQKWRYIYFPHVFRCSWVKFQSQSFLLLKETSLASAIGYQELMWRSSRWMSLPDRWAIAVVVACAGYLLMNTFLSLTFHAAARNSTHKEISV
jgi:polar amino acid transport system permease protein